MTDYVYRHRMPRAIAEEYIKAKLATMSAIDLAQVMTIASGRLHQASEDVNELFYYSADKPKRKKGQ